MSNETIRTGLVDAINEMTSLLELCNDSNQAFELRMKIRDLFQQLDKVIVATLNSGSIEFTDALQSLKDLTDSAKQAKKDLDSVALTISKANSVLEKVEKLIKGVVGVLAL